MSLGYPNDICLMHREINLYYLFDLEIKYLLLN
nr:MAG TPA: hypothetical protein [Bacteriophage sp.]